MTLLAGRHSIRTVIAALEAGPTHESAAAALGVNPRTLRRWLEQHPELEAWRGRPPVVDTREAVALVAREGSVAGAAAALGVSVRTVHRRLAQARGQGHGQGATARAVARG